ncbi:hypothetical protein CH063_14316 [Colletotrichum higginsianum]|uniref:Uncharacterized protein n=1 Tax=Colletotrichum higginsianum (strain IMI 349063) TaxID=759273 RepID=H1VY24_COLHI|nr:hypothetical protein CH063_14316 [Colletotrichum higginsianum]
MVNLTQTNSLTKTRSHPRFSRTGSRTFSGNTVIDNWISEYIIYEAADDRSFPLRLYPTPSPLNGRAVDGLPDLVAQRLVGREPLRQLLLLLQQQVRHQPPEDDAALVVEVRVVVLLEVVRVRLGLADGLHELAAVEVEVDVRRLASRRRGDRALALVGEVVGHDARRAEAAPRQRRHQDRCRPERLDLLGEVDEVGLVLVERDVLLRLLVVVAELRTRISPYQPHAAVGERGGRTERWGREKDFGRESRLTWIVT